MVTWTVLVNGVGVLVPGRARDAGPGGGLAASQGADAEHEFGEVEGLGQVVVGAQGQSGDAVPPPGPRKCRAEPEGA